MSSTNALPQLPVDISELIIDTLWSSPLTKTERTKFTKASMLVSTTWANLFIRVSTKDLRLLSPSHLDAFQRFISSCSPETKELVDNACQAITLSFANDGFFDLTLKEEEKIGRSIARFIDTISEPERLPNLRKVSFQLQNFQLETLFEHNKFLQFPKQVKELEINFTYRDVELEMMQAVKKRVSPTFGLAKARLRHLRTLRVFGASIGITKALLEAFGGVKHLGSFEQDAWLSDEHNRQPQPIVAPPRPIVSDDEEYDEEEEDVFYDSNEDSWEGSEQLLVDSFSKDQLTRILDALQRQMMVAV